MGTHSPHTTLGCIPVLRGGDMASGPNDPKAQAKLKSCSVQFYEDCARHFNKHFIKTISHEKFIILSFGKLMCVDRSLSDLLWRCGHGPVANTCQQRQARWVQLWASLWCFSLESKVGCWINLSCGKQKGAGDLTKSCFLQLRYFAVSFSFLFL